MASQFAIRSSGAVLKYMVVPSAVLGGSFVLIWLSISSAPVLLPLLALVGMRILHTKNKYDRELTKS